MSRSLTTVEKLRTGQTSTKLAKERRGSRRFECDGMAEVTALGGALRFSGKISNLSLTGCYVNTDVPFDLERGTPVEISLGVGGLQFRVGAGVRVLHRGTGVGLEFVNVSPRSGRYIKQLISELSTEKR